jgi:hypothetical protein
LSEAPGAAAPHVQASSVDGIASLKAMITGVPLPFY